MPGPTITAHRGSSAAAPENTLAAFRQATRDGADGVELDVRQAKDGTLVVVHDENLRRVTGVDANVWEMTAEDLAGLEAGAHFAEAFRGEPLPLLEDVIDFARDRLRLNVELKMHGREHGLAPAVVETIRRSDAASDCVVTSSDRDVLREVRTLARELRLGVILRRLTGTETSLDVDLYSVRHSALTEAFVREAHAQGRPVHVWTVDEKAQVRRFAAMGVDDVITNVPRVARAALQAK